MAKNKRAAREKELEGALRELVQWCEDNFFGEDSGPDLDNAYEALEGKRSMNGS